ncbi:MAG: isoprenylcysteine carboxylmethyltransferase family protein [Candidatus Bathyarchaeia archaeon]
MSKPVHGIKKQAIMGLAALAAFLWVALFLPAWSLDYWQAWTYWIIFLAYVTAISVYFLKKDLNLIENRLKAGPAAEKQRSQKLANSLVSLFFILLILIPPLDHHFDWFNVPAYLTIAGDVFVVLGLLTVFLVFKENSYTSVTIEVNKEQKVVSTGPYGVVRHPMYSGALLMMLFTPIALGSFWGLLAFIPMFAVIAFRLLEEEKFLAKNLPGYDEYCQKVHYRLVPFIW